MRSNLSGLSIYVGFCFLFTSNNFAAAVAAAAAFCVHFLFSGLGLLVLLTEGGGIFLGELSLLSTACLLAFFVSAAMLRVSIDPARNVLVGDISLGMFMRYVYWHKNILGECRLVIFCR